MRWPVGAHVGRGRRPVAALSLARAEGSSQAEGGPQPGGGRGNTLRATFRVGNRVLQSVNNYDKDVFNGGLGRVAGVDHTAGRITVNSEETGVDYDFSELDELQPAFAMTGHRAQGSEFPAVVVPVLTQHYPMLQRNLLYTAITRGRRLVVVIGSRLALAIAVGNDLPGERNSMLGLRLRERRREAGRRSMFNVRVSPSPAYSSSAC